MATDFTRRQATLFMLSAQFAKDDIKVKQESTEPTPEWQEAFKQAFFFYYEIFRELAEKI